MRLPDDAEAPEDHAHEVDQEAEAGVFGEDVRESRVDAGELRHQGGQLSDMRAGNDGQQRHGAEHHQRLGGVGPDGGANAARVAVDDDDDGTDDGAQVGRHAEDRLQGGAAGLELGCGVHGEVEDRESSCQRHQHASADRVPRPEQGQSRDLIAVFGGLAEPLVEKQPGDEISDAPADEPPHRREADAVGEADLPDEHEAAAQGRHGR